MNYVEPIRSKAMIHEVEDRLKAYNPKYWCMFEIGIYSGLRVSDILRLRVKDVRGRDEIRVIEQKTKKVKTFPINRELVRVLDEYCAGRNAGEFLVPSDERWPRAKPVSRRRAYQVLRQAGEECGVEHLGTHSMRKTFGYHFYTQTGDIVLLMKILNHCNQAITLRYIGIEQDTINDAMKKYSLKGWD